MSTVVAPRPQAEDAVWNGLRQFAVLPDWLNAATQPESVSDALTRAVPEFLSGERRIEDCDIGSVRFKRNVWTGAYKLTIDERPGQRQVVSLRGTLTPPGQPEPEVATSGAQSPFGSDQWQCYLPELRLKLEPQPPDEGLPSLPILTDAEAARELLERGIRTSGSNYHNFRIERCTPKIMRYSPGSRCTILYRMEYPADTASSHNWPDIVIAKTYKGGKGKHAYAGMCALWDSAFARNGGVTLAEPLAFLPDMNVLVQGPIREEQTLQKLIEGTLRSGAPAAFDTLSHFIRKTAAGLAALHQSEVRFGAVRSWDDELAEVRGVVDDLVRAAPQLGTAAEPLLARLEALATAQPADQAMAAHGTFRPGQVLIYQDQIGFIDFDSFCQAEPALDLSLFLRRTKDIGLSSLDGGEDGTPANEQARLALLARIDAICELFLAEYESHVPVSRQRVALWEALDLLTLVLHCWTKAKPVRLENSMAMLERHLRQMGI